ncbi:MAG: hypothetical protein SH857_11990 [Chitinophagales bacterium]|nr:hypothetical protein [Chitinophagales bacterium]
MKPATSKPENATDIEWFYLKLSFVFVSLPLTGIMVFGGSGCPFPTGICKLYSFAPLFTPIGKPILVSVFVLLCVFYLFEIRMLLATFFLFLLSCIIISHHESNGIFYRATILTTLWGVQFLAYLRLRLNPDFDVRHFRVHYGIQIIAATYALAGIAKLRASGIDWINAGDFFSIQVIKNYAYLYFDTGSETTWQEGKTIAYFLLNHHEIIRFFLAVALMLEVFCLAATLGANMRYVFGIGLLFMHIGIAFIMGIGISVIAKPMIVFFFNPLYQSRRFIIFVNNKIRFFH